MRGPCVHGRRVCPRGTGVRILTLVFAGSLAACGVAGRAKNAAVAGNARPDAILCWATRTFGARDSLVVDLRLRSGNGNRTPTADDERAVTELGGRVLYRFHVAVLRALVDTTALRALLGARNGLADVAYPVADTSQHDVRLQIFYRRATTLADDSILAGHGARGLFGPPRSRVVSATIADSLVPAIAQFPGVAFVRAQAMVCATANGVQRSSSRSG